MRTIETVQVRSFERLDAARAWRRIIWWARRRIEVTDRLPFEVIERLLPGGPALREEQHLQPVLTVMATKVTGTVRPFLRLHPRDLLLYQALVDHLAPCIEAALQARDRVFAFRQTLNGSEDQFLGTPKWSDFESAGRAYLEAHPRSYSLRADISGYFLYVDPLELERGLLERDSDPLVARDLSELLRSWQMLGVRGLPQGTPPSSPLGNFYLAPLDELVEEAGAVHIRYMDDLWIFADSFAEARRVQDAVERYLYRQGLTLSGDKSRIERAETALARLESAEALIENRRQALRAEFARAASNPYEEEEDQPSPGDIDAMAVLDLYEEIVESLRRDEYPPRFRAALREIYRELRAAERPDVVSDVPDLLTRFPDLTRDAMLYVAAVADQDRDQALAAFVQVLRDGRFHREFELLHICQAALYLPSRASAELAALFAKLAENNNHPLVRARALLPWGAQSEAEEFESADRFWESSDRPWRVYPFVAIQDKDVEMRDERYVRWSGAGRTLERLSDSIRRSRFSWKRV